LWEEGKSISGIVGKKCSVIISEFLFFSVNSIIYILCRTITNISKDQINKRYIASQIWLEIRYDLGLSAGLSYKSVLAGKTPREKCCDYRQERNREG